MSGQPTQREYWNSKVGEEWTRQAERTDAMFAGLTDATFDALALQAGERVLDIGCGAGETTLRAARHVGVGGHTVGVDLSQQLLGLARRRAEASGLDAVFIEADAGAGPIGDAPFDAAFSRFGVMFFEEPAQAFAQIRAGVRSGGRLAFVCWRTAKENAWASAPIAALAPMFSAPMQPSDPNLPGPFAFADAGKIKSILESSGWRDIAITPWDGAFVLGRDAEDAASFVLRIGPSARAIAEHGLDAAAAERLIVAQLQQVARPEGVMLDGACWIVRAVA